jgi:hypothetical protein
MLPSRLAVLALVAAAALPSVACRKLAEKAEERAIEKSLEKQGGGQVNINGQNGSMTVTTDASSFEMGAGAKVPDDFPSAVPIYPGAKPAFAARSTDPKGKAAWSVQLETPDSKDQVVAFYKDHMSGFKQSATADLGKSAMAAWDGPQYAVTLMVGAENPKTTSISLNASSK